MTIRITSLNPELLYEAGSALVDPASNTPLPTGTCCEFTGIGIGDTVPVITVQTGASSASDITIWAEGCECSYVDLYDDDYCDPSEGGALPNASITDTEYTISDLPANSLLTIDAVARTVSLTDADGLVQSGGIDALEWAGLFEWIEAARGGCQRVCVDVGTGTATVEILTYDREL